MSHNNHNGHNHGFLRPDVAKKVRGAALLAIFLALVMIIIKAIGWMMTGSVALLGTFLDSVMDLSISVMNFFAIQHAQTPADKEHRFGHGKAEALAGLVQATLLLLAAVFLLYEAAQALLNPRPLTQTNIGIGVLVVSIILTIGLVFVQRRVAKSTGSVALLADSAHYAGDIYVNLGIIGGLILSGYFGFIYADPVLGLVVAGVLANSARQIYVAAGNQLMDRELDDASREKIKQIIKSHPEVRGLHDLRTRQAGLGRFIQCHIELDGNLSLLAAHRISDDVEGLLMRDFANAEVLIHLDPAGYENVTPLERS